MTDRAPVILIEDLVQAMMAGDAAIAAKRPVVLRNPPGSGGLLGPRLFREILAAVGERLPDAEITGEFDCDDALDLALSAIREGLRAVRIEAPPAAFDDLSRMGQEAGCAIRPADPGPTLDLGRQANPKAALSLYLSADH